MCYVQCLKCNVKILKITIALLPLSATLRIKCITIKYILPCTGPMYVKERSIESVLPIDKSKFITRYL